MTTDVSVEEEILETLTDEGEALQSEISSNSSYSNGYVSSVLGDLEDEGVVKRTRQGRTNRVVLNSGADSDILDSLQQGTEDSDDFGEALDPGVDERNPESAAKVNEIKQMRENGDQSDSTEEVEFDEDILEDDGESMEGVHRDDAYGVLKNSRRRDVLRYLDEHDEPVEVGELAEEITALEQGKEITQISSDERKNVYINLTQFHIEKLCEASILEEERNVVSKGENFDLMREFVGESFDSPEKLELTDGSSITPDDFYDILANNRRRALIRYLQEDRTTNVFSGHPADNSNPSAVQLNEIAEKITAVELEKAEEDILNREKRARYNTLYQSHLDRLEQHSIVTYDPESGVIEPGENIDDFAEYVGDSFKDPDSYITVEDVETEEGLLNTALKGLRNQITGFYD